MWCSRAGGPIDFRLLATDNDFSTGKGELVSGDTLALIMVMTGRKEDYYAELSGPGFALLVAQSWRPRAVRVDSGQPPRYLDEDVVANFLAQLLSQLGADRDHMPTRSRWNQSDSQRLIVNFRDHSDRLSRSKQFCRIWNLYI